MLRDRARVALLFCACSLGSIGCYASHERGARGDGGATVGDASVGDASSGDASADGTSSAGPTPADFVELVVRTWCEEMSECPTSEGGEQIARVDVEVCISDSPTAAALREALGRYVDAVDRGRAGFDVSAIPACLDEIASTQCVGRAGLIPRPPPHAFSVGEPGFIGSGPRCDAVFPRALALAAGETCETPLDCAQGLYCAGTPGTTECVRRCAPFARGGEACADGVSCAGADGDLLCLDGHCVALQHGPDAGLGELCDWTLDPPQQRPCIAGLECISGICREVETRAGEACPYVEGFFTGEGCGAGLQCIHDRDHSRWMCLQSHFQEHVGDWCSAATGWTAMLVCDPRARLACHYTEDDEPRCHRMGDGSEGANCDPVQYETCNAGLRCRDGHCALVGAGGTPCTGPWDCQSEWCEDGVCQACDADAMPVYYARVEGRSS